MNDIYSSGRAHENCITYDIILLFSFTWLQCNLLNLYKTNTFDLNIYSCIMPLKKGRDSKVTRFSTSGTKFCYLKLVVCKKVSKVSLVHNSALPSNSRT